MPGILAVLALMYLPVVGVGLAFAVFMLRRRSIKPLKRCDCEWCNRRRESCMGFRALPGDDRCLWCDLPADDHQHFAVRRSR